MLVVINGDMRMKTYNLNNHILEFDEDLHIYIVDGLVVPCVTDILSRRYKDYVGVSQETLKKAADLGTELHKAIEIYEKKGITNNSEEFKNYLFLKKHYKIENIDNEVPIMYEKNGKVLFAGTLDQIYKIDNKLGINDFKRVSAPNKEKIALQVNLYKIGYEQTYHKNIEILSFMHLRKEKRKFYKLPVNEKMAMELVKEYLEVKNDTK